MSPPEPGRSPRYGLYVGLLAVLLLVLLTINTAGTRHTSGRGIEPGHAIPPFAVPLALGQLTGDADIAVRPDQGALGRVPACAERGAQILNICQLYEQGPVVLVLFVNGGGCPEILGDLQALASSFPEVRFAAVAIKGNRDGLRELVRSRQLSFPVGVDSDGALAGLYKVASCPQVTFALPGGVVQSRALLSRPALGVLRARIGALVAAARAHGWRGTGT